MMNRYLKSLAIFIAPVVSGVLLYSIFPPLELSVLSWFALIPLFLVLNYARYLQAFFSGLLTGIILCGLHVYWLNLVPGFPASAYLAIIFYASSFFAIFSLLFSIVIHRTSIPRVLAASFLWVAIEYVRANLSFIAVPWVLLGHSQYQNIPFIQIASVTSVYGVSFLIIMVNVAIAECILYMLNQRTPMRVKQPSFKVLAYSCIATSVIITVVYLWGSHQLEIYGHNDRKLLNVALVQGNIPQNQKWDRTFKHAIMERYRTLTMKAAEGHPDMIIWPETATPGKIGDDKWVDESIKILIKETKLPLLLGSTSNGKLEMSGRKIRREKNSAYLLDTDAEVIDTYHKIRLVPFGEYLPLEGRFQWPKWLVPDHGDTLPGTEFTVFRFPKGNFGVVICWENLFPDLFRRFVRNGAEFMVNLTNEAHFGKTAAPYQMMAMSVFRAIENRVSLLRCANTGITGIVDPLGRIRGKVVDESGNEIFVMGILTTSVPASLGTTFYTRYGDVFAILCVIGGALCILIAAINPQFRASLKKEHVDD